ncbi:MAG: cbb3-type cytochrome c oxidase subunit II [Pollutimonas bauzanensis]|uniref:Cytochrome c oxidase cbb3-type subunit 2 n=1 Tax=Pollutimonas bauzanensis TaxID=658167 RepID=A0A1M5TD25_9BURK|nr:cbb3-type cytochrome c oxidase subunit II [Pollutimonas bauzanensis]SHH48619.1 cytochrome c oxidase cbb3-type subunit 2 [Pollutimonas bauzanensis]
MENELKLIVGAMVTLSLATSAMIVVPFLQLKDEPAPAALKPYTSQELRGRLVYQANACIACHTQQPSTTGAGAADASRGWGRASVAGDYHYDDPPLLGTMRTGPDLFNIGVRQPSADWQLGHLFQPRAYTPGSNMPSYRFLFDVKEPGSVAKNERVVHLPPGAAQEGKVVVASPEAVDLVAYLLSLKRSYPVLTLEQAGALADESASAGDGRAGAARPAGPAGSRP